MPEESQVWGGDQLEIKAVAETTTLKVKEYPCALYNYSPVDKNEDLSDKFVVHYKGENRKIWMLQQWAQLLPAKKAR